MRSASALAALAALVALTGCDTTQQLSARAKVRADRLLASRHAVRVIEPNPAVRAVRIARVDGATSTAFAVALHNAGAQPVNDLPVSVGVRRHGRRAYLNAKPNVPYFLAHTPVVAPGGTATWVFTTRGRAPRGVPFVVVGSAPRKPVTVARSLPRIGVAEERLGRAGAVAARVSNPSDVPQYGLRVYAYGTRGGRVVAAGATSLEHLHTGSTVTVDVGLVGSPRGAQLHVEAPPTIFG